jgi:hypothetical protein
MFNKFIFNVIWSNGNKITDAEGKLVVTKIDCGAY